MENKKTTVLTIVGVLVMIVMVTGISFALYTFTGTGSKENVITTGQISVSYEESSVIELTNQYPMSDELGIGNTESVMNFTVSGTIRGDASINYAIGLDSIVEGTTLTQEFVKVYLLKGDTVVSTFTNGEGKTIESLEEYHIANHMNSHAMYTDTFTTSGSQAYTIKAWVSEDYNLPTTVDGNSNSTTSEQFKFKIKVVGTDQTMTILEDTTPPVIEDIEISKIEETAINYNNLNLARINNEIVVEDQIISAGDILEIDIIYNEKIQGTAPTLNLTFGGTEAKNNVSSGTINGNKIIYTYQTHVDDYGYINVALSRGNINDLAGNISINEISIEVQTISESFAVMQQTKTYSYLSNNYQSFLVPKTGFYQIETWGAEGGDFYAGTTLRGLGGHGGYSSGIIELNYNEKLYIYVGQQGKDITNNNYTVTSGSYNGGGSGTVGTGGGATDIRYFGNHIPTEDELAWDSPLGLNSRIMVAGGGGGASSSKANNNNTGGRGGHGGGLKGTAGGCYNSDYCSCSARCYGGGASQLAGGARPTFDIAYFANLKAGYFGHGTGATFGTAWGTYSGCGGGGGYYGGTAGNYEPGGGGSGFVSGYPGAIAIEQYSNAETETINSAEKRIPRKDVDGVKCTEASAVNDVTCSYHYSGKIFSSPVMITGNAAMPTYDSTTTMIGNQSDGYVKITWKGTSLSQQ